MIQLSYEPAYDLWHTAYRILKINMHALLMQRVPVGFLRVLDFYLLFPEEIGKIRVRRQEMPLRARIAKLTRAELFTIKPDDPFLLERMEPFQLSALSTLAGASIFNKEQLKHGWVTPVAISLLHPIKDRIEQLSELESAIMQLFRIFLADYEFDGVDGLKHRTGLMDFRYDPA